MASPTFKVAAAQVAPIFLDRDKTIDKACAVISEAGRQGAKLVVFPEAFVSAYPDWVWSVPNNQTKILDALYVELVRNAVSIPDANTARLCHAAKTAAINVFIGINEINAEASGSTLYNSLLAIGDQGEILGRHRKLVPTGGERLVWAQGNGSTLQAFDTSVGKIGGLICWENLMPMARQALYDMGIRILVSPTWDKSDSWILSMRHIAREGGVYVISCCMPLNRSDVPDAYAFKNLYPEGREWINPGNSCIIDPKGEIIAGPVNMEEKLIYAEVDLEKSIAAKRVFDVAGHYSRPDVFKFSVVS